MSEFRLTKAQDRARDTLVSDATHNCLGGGSRSGKTLLLLRAVIMRALREEGSRHGVFRFRFNSIKGSIIYDTLPKVMKLCFPGLMDQSELNKTDFFLQLPNGSQLWFGGLDEKERTEKILGQEFATVYFNECSQIPWQSVQLALTRLAQKTKLLKLKAYYDMNPPSKSHWTYRVFVERRDPITKAELPRPENYSFYLLNPEDNAENLDPEYLDLLRSMSARARERFLHGRFAEIDEGALWTVELLDQQRILDTGMVPDMLRIVVAVDPSGCSGEEDYRSDEVGIVVVGLGTNGKGYLIEDLSGRYGPGSWGRIVVDAYKRNSADRVVGEANFGGAMVAHVVRSVDADIPYSEIHASRGKVIRAEPISALYEQGKVHHIGFYPELEDQLCGMTMAGYTGIKSPDRADALVHGLTELFPGMTQSKKARDWKPPQVTTLNRKGNRWETKREQGRKSR